MHPPGAFPTLRTTTRLADGDNKTSDGILHNNLINTIYDVKFYPYTLPDEDAIFAVVSATEICVCRPMLDAKQPYEILRFFRDPQGDASLNSLVWSQDIETKEPLLCVGGAGSSKIKVLNVRTGDFVRAISGHGGAINDLAVSPLSPAILASASADYTIRLWNLESRYAKQPCAAIFAGAGHNQPILAMGFHKTGRYLLSGGTDTMVNLWAVPDVPDINTGTDQPTLVHYPLFSSIEVHSDFVDCIRFHGDLILSHAASTTNEHPNNHILLWKIDGFSSADPVPTDPPVPSPGVFTRSAFGARYQRLLTFEMPYTTPFYMRFSLFDQPGYHPMLVMGNQRSRFSFWDLQRLEEAPMSVGQSSAKKQGRKKGRARANGADVEGSLQPTMERDSPASQGSDKNHADPKYDISDPFRPIPPHHKATVPRYNFVTRQMAWSNCGKWCVAVGDHVIMCVFKRWD